LLLKFVLIHWSLVWPLIVPGLTALNFAHRHMMVDVLHQLV
jgi:hypothetical protein